MPLPFTDLLGDPCAGTNKQLIINYTDKAGSCKVCKWDDGNTPVVDYMQAIRATYSLQVVSLRPSHDGGLSHLMNHVVEATPQLLAPQSRTIQHDIVAIVIISSIFLLPPYCMHQ